MEDIKKIDPLQKAEEIEAKRQADEVIEAYIKVYSAAYDKAAAYSNLIIFAGYASFFGLWQLTKDLVSKSQALWAALLILVSVIVFVLFEVWKMYYSSRALIGLGNILNKPENQGSPDKLFSEIKKYNAEELKRNVRFGRSWHIVLIVTLVSGFGGVAILVWAFIAALLAS